MTDAEKRRLRLKYLLLLRQQASAGHIEAHQIEELINDFDQAIALQEVLAYGVDREENRNE